MCLAKNIIISTLCLTVATPLQLGEECVHSKSGLKGICKGYWAVCSYHLNDYRGRRIIEYCDKAKRIVCCPLVNLKGDECFDTTTRVNEGRCQNLWECNYALKYRKKPRDCDDSSVCCPPVKLRISQKMCFNYIHHTNYPMDIEKSTSDYDYTEKDIGVDGVIQADNVTVGTKKVFSKSSPMAVIGSVYNDEILWNCGGSIISPFFILSSAHCAEIAGLLAKWARIGISDLPDNTRNHLDLRIIKIFLHPDYTFSSRYNDIALYKLEKEIIFGDDYQPACLHTTKNVPEIMEATEWRESDRPSYYLREKVNVIENEICDQRFRKHEHLRNGIIDKLLICAWNASLSTVCALGYEGGPLQYKVEEFESVPGYYVVAAVAAITEGCGSQSNGGVFTRVSAYLDWIEEIVWEDEIEPETVTFVFTN